MAGNVREWCQNETTLGRLILGAADDDANYLFGAWRELPAFDRSPRNGFRCVKYIDRDKIPESAFRSVILGTEIRDYTKVVPVAENIFEVYKNQFLYDSAALNSVIEERDEKPEDWIVEKATFNAAYGGERMIAYLYLPRNTPPPFQTLIFFPGSYTELNMPFTTSNFTINWAFDYILKSGRAVIYPVYKGTFERNDKQDPEMMSHQYTERLTMMVKDFKRTIDYLETRKDIDRGKIGYYGHSWGGRMGAIIPAVEKRLSINILLTGGFSSGKKLTEADEVNYLSRVKIPTLMLNGRYDNIFPLETNAKPFFNLLGTPEKDKRLCVYETDHYVSRNDMIKEVLGWCDKYLGPVK
jgi:dipeptidyl aminopeptidase/acylaminoacyl peptidase